MKMTWRIWLLIIFLILSLISIFGLPPIAFQEGIIVTGVGSNSTAFNEGLRQGQTITFIDGNKILNVEDYANALSNKFISSEKIKTTITTNQGEFILFTNSTPEISVADIPTTRLKLGLDLSGGSRALVQAKDVEISQQQTEDLISSISNRLNAFGISDVQVRQVSDLSGNNFVLVELAGASPSQLRELISQQGKFEAKIGNETVFIGGDKDINSICRNDASCSGIRSCNIVSTGEYQCIFDFTVYLSGEAAQRHADVTGVLEIDPTNPGYLSKPLDLYLDDVLVDTLLIGESLKGSATTQIQIQGSGSGLDQASAYDNAELEMRHLQTILLTGSLPFQLEIIKLDSLSPTLGDNFTNYLLLAGLASFISVAIIIF